MAARVVAVAAKTAHGVKKTLRDEITLIKGLGVEGDAHFGKTVQHVYDKIRNPDAPNLRQVHLMHEELFDALAQRDIIVTAGQMGENIVTRGVDLLGLSRGSQMHIGDAVIEITGLRNPCPQLNAVHPDLLEAVRDKDAQGNIRPQSGVMGIIMQSGTIRAGDMISVTPPETAHQPLEPV